MTISLIHKHRYPLLMLLLITWAQPTSFAQSQNQAAVLFGEGAFLRGAGSYNLNTAQAESINVDTVIRWKQDLRRIMEEKRELQSRSEAGKKLRIEEVKQRQQAREQQLRASPTAIDIQTGDALNVILYDLTDPEITADSWAAHVVQLPTGISVKELTFRFTPSGNSTNTSKALSRGVIALSRLGVAGSKWPTPLRQAELEKERLAYEAAYSRFCDLLIGGDFKPGALAEVDQSLESLRLKVTTHVSKDRGFRDEALKFVGELKDSTHMFDAATVDYAREILIDTKNSDARTVSELVSFMLKYRLQFASAERSPAIRVVYAELFSALQQQARQFGK